jgi:glycosyltransferase involved in cell wall biosynthesis
MLPDYRIKNVALLSYCCDTGVGIAGIDFYSHLPFARWIVVPHRTFGITARRLDSKCYVLDRNPEPTTLKDSLANITTLFCIERGYYPGLFRLARQMGIRIVLMPNAEWFDPDDPEMALIDTFIAPTRVCFDMLVAQAFGNRTEYIPHPIDVDRFRFQLREKAETFLHCRGWGGYKDRKGTDIVLSAAALCPAIQFVIRYQKPLNDDLTDNVVTYPATVEPEDQYEKGDICIQPSRWEGVGLQILEAMACGLPTLVPNAPPMNEYQSDLSLCVTAHPCSVTIGKKQWTQWEMDPQYLARSIKQLHNQPIGEMSKQARASVETRSWSALKHVYMTILGMSP